MRSHLPPLLSSLTIVCAALLLTTSCKTESTCTNSGQCAQGFACNMETQQCEATARDSGPLADIDATPACPGETHFCAAPAPADWQGPVVGTRAEDAEALASCSGAYDTEAKLAFEDLVATGECSCECPGVSTDFSCSSANLETRDDGLGACNTICRAGTCSNPIPPDGSCTSIGDGSFESAPKVRAFLGSVTDPGTCNSSPAESNTLAASFAGQERYCSGEANTEASCPSEGLCMPIADEAFASLCIYRSGDHECPESYPFKELRHEGFDDTRECSECSCSGPSAGTSCGGSITLGSVSSGSCTVSEVFNSNSCIDNPVAGELAIGATYSAASSLSCTATGGELSGDVTPADPLTFCCLEEIPDL